MLAGEAARVKLAATFTVSATVVDAVRLPCVAVIVTAAEPVAAVELAVSVSVLPEPLETLVGLKAAVTPLGRPVAASVAPPANPFNAVSEMELVLLAPPRVMVKLLGDAPSVKLAAALAFTVSATVVDAVRFPLVPVMVTLAAPVVAVAPAVRVRMLGVPLAALVGLKTAVTPVGRPEVPSDALPVNPFRAVSEIELVPPAPPCVIVTLLGAAARVRLGFAVAPGQLFTRFVTLIVPMPVAKSQPVLVP